MSSSHDKLKTVSPVLQMDTALITKDFSEAERLKRKGDPAVGDPFTSKAKHQDYDIAENKKFEEHVNCEVLDQNNRSTEKTDECLKGEILDQDLSNSATVEKHPKCEVVNQESCFTEKIDDRLKCEVLDQDSKSDEDQSLWRAALRDTADAYSAKMMKGGEEETSSQTAGDHGMTLRESTESHSDPSANSEATKQDYLRKCPLVVEDKHGSPAKDVGSVEHSAAHEKDSTRIFGEEHTLDSSSASESSGPLDLRCRNSEQNTSPKKVTGANKRKNYQAFCRSSFKRSKLHHLLEEPYISDITFEKAVERSQTDGDGSSEPDADVCVESFDPKDGGNTPLQRGSVEVVFQCPICHKNFSHKVFLDMHKKTHSKDESLNPVSEVKPPEKPSAGTSGVRRRRKRHPDERPYYCEVCGKCFARSTHLTQHKRMHTGDKPYSCDVCGKSFARGVHLTDHKRLHSGERPYICGVCGKDFAQKSHLTQHMRLHTGERPYKCDGCDKSFADSSTLNRHRKKHLRDSLRKDGVLGTVVQ